MGDPGFDAMVRIIRSQRDVIARQAFRVEQALDAVTKAMMLVVELRAEIHGLRAEIHKLRTTAEKGKEEAAWSQLKSLQ